MNKIYFEKYHKNGALRAKGYYLNRELHGNIELFNDNGHKEKEIEYKNGLKHGIEKLYSPIKNLEFWTFFKNGKIIKKQQRFNYTDNKIKVVEHTTETIKNEYYLKNFKSPYFSKEEQVKRVFWVKSNKYKSELNGRI